MEGAEPSRQPESLTDHAEEGASGGGGRYLRHEVRRLGRGGPGLEQRGGYLVAAPPPRSEAPWLAELPHRPPPAGGEMSGSPAPSREGCGSARSQTPPAAPEGHFLGTGK